MTFTRKILIGTAPWLVIASLLLAALYVEPAAVGDAIEPRPILPQDRFYDVARAGEDKFWMVGNLGKILHSSDGGEHWIDQSPSTENSLQSIAAWDEQELVAVGSAGTVLVSRDGGENWTRVEVPTSEIADTLLRVRVIDDRAWIVGEYGTLLVSEDRGSNWRQAIEPEDLTWHDIAGAGDRLVAVGEFGSILVSRDGGESWDLLEPLVEETLNSVYFDDTGRGFAVGLAGTILVTEDWGESWTRQSSVTEEHLYAVRWDGRSWLAVGANGALVVQANDDLHWNVTRVAENNFAWRTGAVPSGRGWFLVGADQGFYLDESWRPINGNGEID
ncbi:MAG: YCF48-related protein [Xanthomonadales bacterium]|nr:YCF48-related protein [Xanthomonadales bacterium]